MTAPDTLSSAVPVDAGHDRPCQPDGTRPEVDEAAVAELLADLDAAEALRRGLIESGRADTPTVGAVLRQRGATGWCAEAKVAFAVALAEEALRRVLLDRLDGVMHFLAVGGTPDQAVARLERLVCEYHGGTECREAAA